MCVYEREKEKKVREKLSEKYSYKERVGKKKIEREKERAQFVIFMFLKR